MGSFFEMLRENSHGTLYSHPITLEESVGKLRTPGIYRLEAKKNGVTGYKIGVASGGESKDMYCIPWKDKRNIEITLNRQVRFLITFQSRNSRTIITPAPTLVTPKISITSEPTGQGTSANQKLFDGEGVIVGIKSEYGRWGFWLQRSDVDGKAVNELKKLTWDQKENVLLAKNEFQLSDQVYHKILANQTMTKAVSALYRANFNVKSLYDRIAASKGLCNALALLEDYRGLSPMYYVDAVLCSYEVNHKFVEEPYLSRIRTNLTLQQVISAAGAYAQMVDNPESANITFNFVNKLLTSRQSAWYTEIDAFVNNKSPYKSSWEHGAKTRSAVMAKFMGASHFKSNGLTSQVTFIEPKTSSTSLAGATGAPVTASSKFGTSLAPHHSSNKQQPIRCNRYCIDPYILSSFNQMLFDSKNASIADFMRHKDLLLYVDIWEHSHQENITQGGRVVLLALPGIDEPTKEKELDILFGVLAKLFEDGWMKKITAFSENGVLTVDVYSIEQDVDYGLSIFAAVGLFYFYVYLTVDEVREIKSKVSSNINYKKVVSELETEKYSYSKAVGERNILFHPSEIYDVSDIASHGPHLDQGKKADFKVIDALEHISLNRKQFLELSESSKKLEYIRGDYVKKFDKLRKKTDKLFDDCKSFEEFHAKQKWYNDSLAKEYTVCKTDHDTIIETIDKLPKESKQKASSREEQGQKRETIYSERLKAEKKMILKKMKFACSGITEEARARRGISSGIQHAAQNYLASMVKSRLTTRKKAIATFNSKFGKYFRVAVVNNTLKAEFSGEHDLLGLRKTDYRNMINDILAVCYSKMGWRGKSRAVDFLLGQPLLSQMYGQFVKSKTQKGYRWEFNENESAAADRYINYINRAVSKLFSHNEGMVDYVNAIAGYTDHVNELVETHDNLENDLMVFQRRFKSYRRKVLAKKTGTELPGNPKVTSSSTIDSSVDDTVVEPIPVSVPLSREELLAKMIPEQKKYKRQHKESSSKLVYIGQLFHYLVYQKYLQAYKAEEMMIYDIKWNVNMGLLVKKPKDYIKVIDEMESKKTVVLKHNKSGTIVGYEQGYKLDYSDDDILNYYMRDGLEIQGNANGFIKSYGFTTEVTAFVDIAKILNPMSYGKQLGVSVALMEPSVKLALAGEYSKQQTYFILQYALPIPPCIEEGASSEYFDKCFIRMTGFKTKKRVAAAFDMSVQAGVEVGLSSSREDFSFLDQKFGNKPSGPGVVLDGSNDTYSMMGKKFDSKHKKMGKYASYSGFAAAQAGVGVNISAVEACGQYSVETFAFIGNMAAYFQEESLMRKEIKNDVLNVLHPYDTEAGLEFQVQPSIFEQGELNEDFYRIRSLSDYVACLEMHTTDKQSEVSLGKATAYVTAGATVQGNLNAPGLSSKALEVDATLVDADVEACVYNRKAHTKMRKSRLHLPFKPFFNKDEVYFYTQDTEIVYCKEVAYSWLSYSANINKLCSFSLAVEQNQDDFQENWENMKDEVVTKQEQQVYVDKSVSVVKDKKIVEGAYKAEEYHENSLMYTSINHIWGKEKKKYCGSCFNIGKSIDLVPLTLFYKKYFDLEKLYKEVFKKDLLTELKKEKLSMAAFFDKSFSSYLKDAKESLKSVDEAKFKSDYNGSIYSNVYSGGSLYAVSRWKESQPKRKKKVFKDIVLDKFTVSFFQDVTDAGIFNRRKSIVAVDQTLQTYWDHVKIFSVASLKHADASDVFEEINTRTGLLMNIIDECNNWKSGSGTGIPKTKSNGRWRGVNALINACNSTIDHYTRRSLGVLSKKFMLMLEVQKLLTLLKPLEGVCETLRISRTLGMSYFLPVSDNSKQPDRDIGIIGLVFDLVEYENIKAAIFESVHDLDMSKYTRNDGTRIYYNTGIGKEDFKDMKLPNAKLLKECSDKTNVGMRLLFRREDSFEDKKAIYQLGTRSVGIDLSDKLDITVGLSYEHMQSVFAAVSLYSQSKSSKKSVDEFYKTILVS
ncbi:MAG: hypothetical protein GY750_20640 [Lentisphaerae bacterium]|nr:hypothetical protein [Lentisphaerota bacterium]MCP4103801.1 hypothetical protein [Lentisphaerota bacterium]